MLLQVIRRVLRAIRSHLEPIREGRLIEMTSNSEATATVIIHDRTLAVYRRSGKDEATVPSAAADLQPNHTPGVKEGP
jgi:hypothetical protein